MTTPDLSPSTSTADRLRRALVARRMAASATPAAPAGLPRTDRTMPLPASFAQERLWFLERLAHGGDDYVLTFARRVRGPLDRAAWQGALDDLIDRHEVLRTALIERDGRLEQQVADSVTTPLTWCDIPERGSSDERLAEALCQARAFSRRRFDLSTAPVLRSGVWRLGPDDAVAVVTVHHSACDGWSGPVLIRELTALYRARIAGTPAGLPDLPVQYADFAAWQRARVAGDVLAGQLAYWRRRLDGVPPLDPPADRPRPERRTGAGGATEATVPASLLRGLEELGRARGATLFMVLLAAYQLVLARWSGQDDIAVGTPVAGRNRVELEPLVGAFVNTLVMRGDLSGDPAFSSLLDRVRDTVLDAFDHQDVPFERLVEELRPDRETGHNPLFQAWLVLQNYAPAAETEDAGFLEHLELPADEVFAPFDLSLMAYPGDAGDLVLRFTYAAELFDSATAERFAGHVVRTLESAVSDPDLPAAALSLLAPGERAALLARAGAPEPVGVPGLLPLITGRAADPAATALVSGEETLTYAGLDAAADALAARLTAVGVRPGDAVGVCLARGVHAVAVMLAVWRAGGVHVPLDPEYPADRLGFMVDQAAVRHVVADATTAGVCAGLGVDVLQTGPGTGEDVPAAPRPAAAPACRPGDVAYVVFTSGSTGRPKAVAVEHRALSRHVAAARERFGVTREDRVLAFSSFTFDAVLDQLLPALTAGGTVVVRPDEPWLPSRIPSLLAQHGITVANFPPTFWVETAASLTPAARNDLSVLRLLVLGGEAVPPGPLAAWRAALPHVRVLNAYGPTEAAVTALTHEVTADHALRVPIGRPLGGRRVYVVDTLMEPVPTGMPGELLIGGPELARGYLGRPGLTAERFVPDVFGGAGGRLYRTGDLVRWREDGELEFLGRLDDQVKIRGFRVEPGEIEAALLRHPGITAAAVVVRPDARGGAALAGYAVPAPGTTADPAALRAWCAQTLPHYMVPSTVTVLDALPVTASGKLDRVSLPAPTVTGVAGYTAPRNGTERVIAEVWEEVLGVDRVGIDDGFFDLGGHSLLATMAVSRIAERLGRDMELRTLFENPRVRSLAAVAAGARTAVTTGVVPLDRSGDLPMSYAQERLWFLDRMSEARDDYVVWFSWRVPGGLDRAAWQAALDGVVARHEVLRTALIEVDGRPVQRVLTGVTALLEWHDSAPAGDGPAARETRVLEQARDFATRGFDLAAPPLLRSAVWPSDGDAVVVLSMHHVAVDGWSKDILLRELAVLYTAALSGTPADLPAPPVQYGDFAVWQRERLTGPLLERRLGYWCEALSGLPTLELPTDRPHPPVRSGRGGAVEVELPGTLRTSLEETARGAGATPFMVLLAAFQVVLSRWSGQDDIAVGTPVAGRDRTELEPLIGFFVNTLVLRGDLSGNPSFTEYLARVRENVLGAFSHRELPFERLVQELRPDRDLSRNPLFQVMFDVSESSPGPAGARLDTELGMVSYPLNRHSAKFDLTAHFTLRPERFTLNLEYSTDVFDEETVRRLAGHVERVLHAVSADASTPVARLEILPESEYRHLLDLAGSAEPVGPAVPAPVCGADDDTAVVCEDTTLTYAELDGLVGGLARRLTEHGVTPGGVVGVCVRRGIWSVAAMLAVWRARCVYVPMDAEFPHARLAHMVAESGTGWIVADADTEGVARALGADVVSVEGVEPASGTPVPVPDASELAYVIFTSGSSGRPKAVGVEHGALARHLSAARRRFGLTGTDRVMAFASFSFDASLEQVLPALCSGARVIVRPDTLWSADELAARVKAEGVTVMELTPSYWEEVVARLPVVAEDLKGLRLLVSGAEALPSGPLRDWFAHLPHVPIDSTYGATEAAISSTSHLVTGPVTGRVPVGRPWGDRRAYVVDDHDRLVPLGVPGHLLVGGPEIARGYLGRPALTAERFVPDPWSSTGGRLYRTGDRARWLPDGDLELLGRADDQVKIRGFRIEPGEIEAVLAELDGIHQAAVLVQSVGGQPHLVAYTTGPTTDTAVIDRHARRHLPVPMVPTHYLPLDALPLTVQGKLDARALPLPAVAAGPVGHEPPRTPTEIVTAQVWEEVLGVEDVGLHDNFFGLGGHSIRAVAAASRLRAAFDCPVQVRHLFEHPTVALLAAEVERQLIEQIAAMSDEEIALSLTTEQPNR